MPAVLRVQGLVKRWEDPARTTLIEVEEFELRPGDCKALVGPSGCGKSTVLDMLALALRPDSCRSFRLENGREQVDINALFSAGNRDRLAGLRGRHFGYVLQTGGLLPFLTAGENIALPQLLSGRRDASFLREIAERLGIAPLLGSYPAQLSVGQRQRVAVARGISHRPDFILADEPTAALDPHVARATVALCLDLARQLGAAVLFVSHDRPLIEEFGIAAAPARTQDDGRAWRTWFTDPVAVPVS